MSDSPPTQSRLAASSSSTQPSLPTRRPPVASGVGALCCSVLVAAAAVGWSGSTLGALIAGTVGVIGVAGAWAWRRGLLTPALLLLGTTAALSLPGPPTSFVVASLEGLALWLVFELVWRRPAPGQTLIMRRRYRQVGIVLLCTAVADPLVAVADAIRPTGVGWFVAGAAALLGVLGLLAWSVRSLTAPQHGATAPDGDT